MTKRLFLSCVVLALVIIGVLPLLSMIYRSLEGEGGFTWDAYKDVLASSRQWRLMLHSFSLAALVTACTLALGVPLGILLGKTDLPLRRFFIMLFVIPLLIPPYIMAVSWSDLLGRQGLLARLGGTGIVETASRLLFGLPGCVFVLSAIFLPVPLLFTLFFLRTINVRLEEAARLVSGWKGILKSITLPLVLPGVLLAAMLVFLLAFGEFSVPNFLRYDVFPVESFIQFSAFYNFRAATAAAVPLIIVPLVFLTIEALFLENKTGSLRPAGEENQVLRIPLGRWKPVALAAVALVAFTLVLVPLLVLVIQSADRAAYTEALDRAGDSLARSLLYAALGATGLTCLGFFTGYLVYSRGLKSWRLVDSLAIFLFALPGTVTGIGLISLWNRPWTNAIYSTCAIIILGYLAKYTALASRLTVIQLGRIPASMEEAAQVAGAGWFRRIGLIVLPLARRGLLAVWVTGYIFSLRDTDITMLVYPAGHETLPVRIFTLMANGSQSLTAALCVLMITATLLPAGLLGIVSGLLPMRGKQ